MKNRLTKKEITNVIIETISEEIYFDTYSGAVGFAKEKVESKGISIDEEDWWNNISMGPGRPKEGETVRHTIGLYKNGKQLRKALQIQVYNRGNNVKRNYELNYYIN